MIGKIFEDGKRRDGKNLLLPHQAHRFLAKLVGMIDRSHSGLRRIQSPRLAGSVHRNPLADSRRLFHRSGEFRLRVLVNRRVLSVANRVRTGFINLDEVRAFFELLPDHGNQFVRIIRISGVRQNVLLGVVVDSILVPPEDVDSVAADAQPRPRKPALVDCVANRGVSGARAFGSHVALRREPGHEIVACRQQSRDRALRHRLLNGLQVLCAGMQKKVNVRINQAGKQSAVAQINDLRSCRMFDRRAYLDDAFPLHQNFTRLYHPAVLDIKQAGSMQHDGMRRRRLRERGSEPCEKQPGSQRENKSMSDHDQHAIVAPSLEKIPETTWLC